METIFLLQEMGSDQDSLDVLLGVFKSYSAAEEFFKNFLKKQRYIAMLEAVEKNIRKFENVNHKNLPFSIYGDYRGSEYYQMWEINFYEKDLPYLKSNGITSTNPLGVWFNGYIIIELEIDG